MTGFILSPAAQTDVDSIWDYTVAEWSEQRAFEYTNAIRDLCKALADERLKGRSANIREGCRKALAGSHVLYFKTQDDGIVIVIRILH